MPTGSIGARRPPPLPRTPSITNPQVLITMIETMRPGRATSHEHMSGSTLLGPAVLLEKMRQGRATSHEHMSGSTFLGPDSPALARAQGNGVTGGQGRWPSPSHHWLSYPTSRFDTPLPCPAPHP